LLEGNKIEARDNAKVIATSAKGEEEVRIGLQVYIMDGSISKYDLRDCR
jgi:hypothetical protein